MKIVLAGFSSLLAYNKRIPIFCNMNRAERELIDHYSPQIVQDVIPVDMLPYLPCLTQSDKERITCEETQNGPIRATLELLSRIRRRTGGFREFLNALRASGCGHLADLFYPTQQGKWKSKRHTCK